MEWKGFAKIWLWILVIFHVLGIVAAGIVVFTGNNTVVGIETLLLEVAYLLSLYMLLFQKKKAGLYIVTAAYVTSAFLGILNNGSSGWMTAAASAVGIAILWFAVKDYISSLE